MDKSYNRDLNSHRENVFTSYRNGVISILELHGRLNKSLLNKIMNAESCEEISDIVKSDEEIL